jgi:hypothetical protein
MPRPNQAFRGCFGRGVTYTEGKYAGDASQIIDFDTPEWKPVKSTLEQTRPIVSENCQTWNLQA